MRQRRPGKLNLTMAVVSLLSLSAFVQPASAKARHSAVRVHHTGFSNASHVSHGSHKMTFSAASYHISGRAAGRYAGGRWHPAAGRRYSLRGGYEGSHVMLHHGYSYGSGHVIQCVAYAKSASDVALGGNARDWWHNAAGVYDRGHAPAEGSILNFRPIRRMPLGHVAVVRNVVDNRTIVIDQSHWGQAGISRNVSVIDVSPNNDWSAVRVALNNRSGTYGSIYPTYGFIYPRSHEAHHSSSHDVMTAWARKTRAQGGETQLAQAPENAHPLTSGAEDSSITFDGQQ